MFNEVVSMSELIRSVWTCCSFLSCLITGILTHHLSWASTVTPVGDAPASTYLDKHMAKWVSSPFGCTLLLTYCSQGERLGFIYVFYCCCVMSFVYGCTNWV